MVNRQKGTWQQLAPSQGALPPDCASRRLGGITIWAPNEEILNTGLRTLTDAIRSTGSTFLTCTRAVLKKQVEEATDSGPIEQKIFGATLGRLMSLGEADDLIVASKNDKYYRAILWRKRVGDFTKALQTAHTLLASRQVLKVKDLETAIFGGRRFNTWSSASHVLGHLNYKGAAIQIDDMTYSRAPVWP